MQNMSNVTLKTIESFEDWLEDNENEELTTLRNTLKHGEVTKKDFLHFVRLLKQGPLGNILVCKLKSFRLTNTKKYVIKAVVMQPDNNGYRICPNPLDISKEWEVTTIIREDKTKESLEEGMLFRTSYSAPSDERYFNDIVYLDRHQFQKIHQSFEDKLIDYGGNTLFYHAEKYFGNDIERTIAERLMTLSNDVQENLKDEKEKIEKLESNLTELEKQYMIRKNELDDNSKAWLQVLKQIEVFRKMDEKEEQKNTIEKHSIEDPETMVKLLQSLIYHNSEDDLIYDETIIELFIRGLQSNILVILSGPSGTGKSSIVSAIGGAIAGTKVKMIPVQSSWTDTQDLLGYFNPIDKCFVPSPFMEALADARQDSENLHLICLDEMNLAHVEYYFSEFLSAREKEEPSIRLYSKRYFTNAKILIENMSSENHSEEKYINAFELINRYTYEFTIPGNVRFIGTVNMDHTVKPLSPKVIDRSLIIELGHLKRTDKEKIETELKNMVKSGCIDITLEDFIHPLHDEEDVKKEAYKIMDLSRKLYSIPNTPLNSRGYKQIVQYLMRTPEKERTTAIEEKYIDQLVFAKLLPRIELTRRDVEGIAAAENLKNALKDYPRSFEKLDSMLSDERIIRFW